MCGIFCSLLRGKEDSLDFHSTTCSVPDCSTALSQLLSNRGPNSNGEIQINVGENWKSKFESHVLWLQGDKPTQQPIVDKLQNILLWNGDIFNNLNSDALGKGCDTNILSEMLHNASQSDLSERAILEVMSKIEGPWCFIFWHRRKQQLWFGRDSMGRHSLLWSYPSNTEGLILTSVATRQDLPSCRELPAAGIFVASIDHEVSIQLYPWNTANIEELQSIYPTQDFPPNLQICQNNHLISPYTLSNLDVPKENDLYIYTLNNIIASKDLVNPEQIFHFLLQDEEIFGRVKKLFDCLKESVNVRCKTQPQLCKICVSLRLQQSEVKSQTCSHSKVAVLFSGGLDSAVIAALADKCIPENEEIDLVNIAFQTERNVSVATHHKEKRKNREDINQEPTPESSTDAKFHVPDRLTGWKTYQELITISPNRMWNFIEVNVTKSELVELRQDRIADLIFPRGSVLDDSLGCAVWFAARGRGTLHRPDGTTEQEYTSPARVLLLGMGADELLGGYSRCRKLLTRTEDWNQIAQSLNHDLVALPTRNLGRDDRVTSDSGRQARFPFLGEGVVRLLASLPAHLRTSPLPGLAAGVGEKLLLRLLAAHLGIHSAAQAPKRALQFGSKVAGLEARNEKGDDVCSRLLLPLI